jgi:membrane protease subunit HflK
MNNDFKFYLKRIGLGIIAFVFIIAIVSSLYTINEGQQAVITTFGKATIVTEKGLHVKVPFVQKVTKVSTEVEGYKMGYRSTDNGPVKVPAESLMITADYNFINVDFYGEYKVSDPIKYLYSSENPEEILRNVTQHAIRTVIGSYSVDDVLTTGKSEIQLNVKELIVFKINELDIGLQMVNITIQDANPPTEEVIAAFKNVENAKQSKETALNLAYQYENENIPAAEAEADKIIQKAEGIKASRVNEAEGQVARFNQMYTEYVKYPLITKDRMFYEAMEELLPNIKVVIEGSGGTNQILPLDDFTSQNYQMEDNNE